MGANQSRPSEAVVQEKLIERLQALQVKDERSMNEKEGYIYIDSASSTYMAYLWSQHVH
jgi:bleomycin hydrolase